jgi:hypothetical protein
MIALAAEAIEYAHHNGYRQTRFVAHMEWALTDGAGMEELAEYDAKANFGVPRDGDPVICVYDLTRRGGQALADVMRTHPMIILGGILYENPLYLPPGEFLFELREREPGRG